MERLFDQLIGDMRAIEVAGVDMIDAGLDGLAQNGKRAVNVMGRSPHLRTGKLHGTIAHAVHGR